jgi:hypothetical protein
MQDLINAVADMMEDEALTLAKKYLDEGTPPMQIIDAYKEALGMGTFPLLSGKAYP